MNLISRLEQAEAGSRELDAEIAKAFGIEGSICSGPNVKTTITHRAYSTSIDAAMSLKPDDHAAAVGTMFGNCSRKPWACIWTPEGEPKFHAEAATPALALVIASLKAAGYE